MSEFITIAMMGDKEEAGLVPRKLLTRRTSALTLKRGIAKMKNQASNQHDTDNSGGINQ